ncbi:MAG: hypothetical protein QOI66_2475 [Myxococcales bacterium]|nr:hypothetical protein [Myxococcales bacterium]
MNDRPREDRSASSDETAELPPRLFGHPGRQGDVVRRYLRRPHGGAESRAWQRLQDARSSEALGWPSPQRRPIWRRRRRWIAHSVAALMAASALGAIGLLATRTPPPATTTTAASTPPTTTTTDDNRGPEPPVAPSAPRAVGPSIALGRRAQSLGPGHWTIADEASLELGPGSAARARRTAAGAPTVSLASGQISLSVVHKPRPAPFRVNSPPYVFTVLGTVFQVERRPTTVELAVSEGRVAVSSAGRQLATITAGGRWSGGLAPKAPGKNETPQTAASAEVALRSSGDPRANAVAGHACAAELGSAQRLACLRVQASGAGLAAETALYEIGKMTRDELHDPAAALATFETVRQRFPDGVLRIETALSIVELLARTGRYYQALDDSAALLARAGNAERAAELHLLRGNIYREALSDLTRAAQEYTQAAGLSSGASRASRAATADEAQFLHAVTLEALGQRDQAAAGYRQYLNRARPVHEREAWERLERLGQAPTGHQ